MAVRWGFLGAGGIARQALAPAVHAAAGATLQAVAARDPDRAAGLEPLRVHADYAALLDDDDVDAVYISLSNEAHLPWAAAALAAGKHVLCEKPLALDVAEVDQLTAVAEFHDRLLVEASMWRWHPRTRRLQDLVRAGAVGDVAHIEAGFTFTGTITGNYRDDPERGGGALYDVGCYALSAVLVALGSRPLTDVRARHELGTSGVDLTTEAILEFEGDAVASIRASMREPEAQWLTMTGSGGELECSRPVFTAWHADTVELLISDGTGTAREVFEPVDPYRLMVEAMSARIRGDEQSWVLPLAQTRRGAELLDSVRAAVRG